MAQILVDVIIPIYNAYDETLKCLQSVFKNTKSQFNLILVNDGSTDKETINLILNTKKKDHMNSPFLKDLTLITNTNNKGFIKSVNSALKKSQNHVILLNTDTIVPNNWTTRLTTPFLKNKDIGSVTPISNNSSVSAFPHFDKINELPQGVTPNSVDKFLLKHGPNKIVEVPTGIGFCLAMNKEAIRQVGILDEEFGEGYGEETDWCIRAKKLGFKSVVKCNIFVFHEGGKSFKNTPLTPHERMKKNFKILMNKHSEYKKEIKRVFQGEDFLEKPMREVTNKYLKAVKQLYKS